MQCYIFMLLTSISYEGFYGYIYSLDGEGRDRGGRRRYHCELYRKEIFFQQFRDTAQ